MLLTYQENYNQLSMLRTFFGLILQYFDVALKVSLLTINIQICLLYFIF